MRMMSISLASCLVVLSFGVYAAVEKPTWLPGLAAEDSVLVLLVRSERQIEQLGRTASPTRVAAVTPRGIAFHTGHIAAVDQAAASDLINDLGWIDRRIELLTPGEGAGSRMGAPTQTIGDTASEAPEAPGDWLMGSGETTMSAEKRRARLRELSGKRELSRGEQIFVMRALADDITP
jgi:hypothetical protein